MMDLQSEDWFKLNQLLAKFKAFQERVRYESDLLLQDVHKYIIQTEFNSSGKEGKSEKLLNINFFRQQMSYLVRPCELMVEKIQLQLKQV